MVSVLFAAKNSVYKTLPGVDVWDEERDALKWTGGNPIVAHPPCRLWSQLAHFSTAPEQEKELAVFAVHQVKKWGGVLEHPAMSKLWVAMDLPRPGKRDEHGFTLAVNQWWWGHMARKSTWLYICGCNLLPEIPLRLGEAEFSCASHRNKIRPEIPRSQRSATPPDFAKWLIELASRCDVSHSVRKKKLDKIQETSLK